MTVEDKITQTVQKNAPYAVDMITGWISVAMMGNRHIVQKITHCRMTFKSNQSMKFTARAHVLTGRNFDREIVAKFVWTKSGSKLQAKFTEIGV